MSDGNAPVVPMGTVPYYGKLDVQSAFVTVLPPLWCAPLVVEDSEQVPTFVFGTVSVNMP